MSLPRMLIRASLTSGSLYVVGDLINQNWVSAGNYPVWNSQQTMRFGLTGALLHGPYFLLGFRQLDRIFPNKTVGHALAKTAMGQIFIFPPFVALFLSFTALLERQSSSDYLSSRFWAINRSGILVWPAANFINFRFVPSHLRIAYINLIGIGWNTYLSWASQQIVKRDL